jgi:hypothetical protein
MKYYFEVRNYKHDDGSKTSKLYLKTYTASALM